jgi:hypothetical protein
VRRGDVHRDHDIADHDIADHDLGDRDDCDRDGGHRGRDHGRRGHPGAHDHGDDPGELQRLTAVPPQPV